MDELIKLVSEKTGLSQEISKTAVETVINFLTKKLPDPIASQIDNVLSGAGAVEGLGDLVEGLGGLLGNK